MRLGSCYVDTKGERCDNPFWTIADINDKNKSYPPGQGKNASKFRIFKNGIHFNFQKGQPGGQESPINVTQVPPSQAGNDPLSERQSSVASQSVYIENIRTFLDSVVYKV